MGEIALLPEMTREPVIRVQLASGDVHRLRASVWNGRRTEAWLLALRSTQFLRDRPLTL